MSAVPDAIGPLPAAAERLFPHEHEADLRREAGKSLLIERLFEDGDGDDLRWLVGQIGEPELGRWFAERAGRKLSRRSRAYWSVVLGIDAPTTPALAAALWPLA